MHTIAYLGPAGTFSEEAAIRYAADRGDVAYLPLASIPAVVTAIETDAATVGLLPIENLLEGSVSFTLDLLIHETALQIAGETVIPIRQYLVTRPGVAMSEVKVLYAHPQSLGQCRKFVERCLPGVATVASLSNSAAPAEAMADDRPAAAISTWRAAEITGAQVVAREIADNLGNVTRFIVLARQGAPPTGDDKTSFCFGFTTTDRAGTLVGALQELALSRHQHDQGRVPAVQDAPRPVHLPGRHQRTSRGGARGAGAGTPPGAHRDAQGVRQLPALAAVARAAAPPVSPRRPALNQGSRSATGMSEPGAPSGVTDAGGRRISTDR